MVFKDPPVLALIPLVVFLSYYLHRRRNSSAFRYSSTDLFAGVGRGWKAKLFPVLWLLRLEVLILMILALAGPRSILEESKHEREGIDIILAIDCSGSMAAEDFAFNGRRINRLAIVKKVVAEFIDGRSADRLGLVAFGARAYTVSPLTNDLPWLKTNLERVELGLVEDGTAIGSGIASSIGRLQDSHSKSKVIILLTDGMNNAGKIDPLSAAKAAKAFGIKIYAIGAGTKGFAPFPAQDIMGNRVMQKIRIDIDEDTLKEIAKITGGQYFRATDTDSLRQIYKEIDAMEKTIETDIGYRQFRELYPGLLLFALGFLALEVLLRNTVLLRIP